MISRLFIATAVLTSTLAGVAVTTAPAKPTLFAFSGPGPNGGPCGGCVDFGQAMQRADFGRPLKDVVHYRAYDVRDPKARSFVRDFKVTSWPTFVLVYDGQIIRRAVGFENSAEFRSGFLRSLTTAIGMECEDGICKPIAEPRKLPPATIESDTSAAPSTANPVDRIAEINARLQQRLQETEDALRITEDRLQAERRHNDSATAEAAVKRWAEERRILEAARQRAIAEADELRERLRQPPASPFEPGPSPLANGTDTQTLPNPPAAPSDISAEMSEPGVTSSKWLSVLRWTGTTAITLAAPEFVIPGSIAMTALGVGISTLRKRRQQRAASRQLGTAANPITIHEPAATKTETKYVITESDVLGESYREAVRRVGNAHREKNPGIVNLLKQIDGVAMQLAHGQRVTRRPANESTSETLP